MKNKLKILGFIVSLMILGVALGVCLVLIFGYTVSTGYCGLAVVGSFILSAIILGLYSNKVINKIQMLW